MRSIKIDSPASLLALKHLCLSQGLYFLAVNSTRLPSSGVTDLEEGWTFVYHNAADPQEGEYRGVGFILSPAASEAWNHAGKPTLPDNGGRVLTIRLRCKHEGDLVAISCYAPIATAAATVLDEFYASLQQAVTSASRGDV